ncbi:hypothetical protein RJ639_017896 [Escallonia herrerae]|uniref:HTH myb-type domain-containing protein n=1 Tax=Escallonia herrerae TaxID=1293975 RepID=A0AA88V918_9ASTE|nr:hypothetical protein RJ639_017896 [Escallonia herrerae]
MVHDLELLSRPSVKRPRLVWTPQLHKRFVDVVAHLGIKNALPKTIMQLMNVEGLTRENVASHLQKVVLEKDAGAVERRAVAVGPLVCVHAGAAELARARRELAYAGFDELFPADDANAGLQAPRGWRVLPWV